MLPNINKPDSIIFDMDGTLWDAVDTYAASWNQGLQVENINRLITRKDIDFMMGWEKKKVLAHLLPEYDEALQEQIYNTVKSIRTKLVPLMGGIVYDGVKEGIEKLSEKYKLFIISNCPEYTIVQFMKWAGVSHAITDEMAFGVNSMPKHHNIKLMIEKHQLKTPVYVGDTETDSIESRKAGIPFIFIEGGFGVAADYDLKFKDFIAFNDYFLNL